MKTVLITGVTGGIGSATAAVFALAGWQIIGVDRMEPKDTSDYRKFYQADLADENQVRQLFVNVAMEVGRLDAVVNNAALQLCKPLVETTGAEWDAVMSVNLRGAFLVMRASHFLLCQQGGAIVNVGSVHARATSRNIAAYAASKGGLEALTRAAALEFATHGIRVNGVHPGSVETEMLKDGLSRGHLAGATTGELLGQLGQKHPLGRVGRPEEISEAILFLADNQKSSFITGEFLVVDGGALCRLSTE